MAPRHNKKEAEILAYRLLEGEIRHRLARDGALVHWSELPAKSEKPLGTIVLLHGVASNGSRWEEFLDTTSLTEHWNFIRMDLRGHAASICRGKAKLESWAGDVKAVMTEAGVAKAVIIGHSLGAMIGLYFVAHNPESVEGAVFLDPLISEALTPKARSMRRKVPMLVVAEAVTRAMNSLGFNRKIVPQDLRAMDAKAREMIAKGGDELKAFIEQYSSTKADLQYIHLAPYLRDLVEVGRRTPVPEMIRCPSLVIAASSGTFTDAEALAAWTKRLSDGEIASVQCAHWPMTECPQEVSGVISEWIGRHFGA